MDNMPEFHDPFNGGATSAFDEPNAFSSFWDELNVGNLAQPSPQSTAPPTESHTFQQQEDEEDEVQDGEEEVDEDGQPFLQEWDGTTEPPVDTLRYTVEWKAVLKTKRLGMNTEEDIFLSPKAFWDATLQHSLDTSLDREFSHQNRPEPCNTLVVVSVNKRAERDLTKEFVGLDIDWSLIEEKQSWACHFREGNRLLVKITFRFRPRNAAPQTNPGRGGRQSATRRQRHQQALQQDAETHASGEGAHWRTVYRTMRCPGRPCKNNQGHCWRDPHGGKHYKLLTAHMRKLVAHMNEGKKFESHHDVPDAIRQQLYAEADQRTEAHRDTRPSHPRMPHGLMCESSPASEQRGQQCFPGRTPPTLVATPKPFVLEPLDIPGSHEKAIQSYVKWQQDHADSQEWIGQFAKAGEILITQGFRLTLFYQTQRVDLLTEGGVLQGIAESFHNDLPTWLPEYREKFEEGQIYSRETPGYI